MRFLNTFSSADEADAILCSFFVNMLNTYLVYTGELKGVDISGAPCRFVSTSVSVLFCRSVLLSVLIDGDVLLLTHPPHHPCELLVSFVISMYHES